MFPGSIASDLGAGLRAEVVEIALALPAQRMEALVALSKRRSQTVGQILRRLIDQALDDET